MPGLLRPRGGPPSHCRIRCRSIYFRPACRTVCGHFRARFGRFRSWTTGMSAERQPDVIPFGEFEQLRQARDIIRHEAQALEELSRKLDSAFARAVALISRCRGATVVTGMGKAGLIGRKVTATFSSTGTRALFLHPAEAVHGDIGCVGPADVVVALSNSGETEELNRLLPIFRRIGAPLIAVTSKETSTLGRAAEVAILLGHIREACPFGLAPTASTAAML